jgi:hypothetical protein
MALLIGTLQTSSPNTFLAFGSLATNPVFLFCLVEGFDSTPTSINIIGLALWTR